MSEEVRRRVPLAQARAAQKVAHASLNPAAAALLQAGQRARSARQRVVWLQRSGSAHVAPLAEVAACRRGCAHCCHIAVQITSTEASLIAAVTGRPAATPRHALVLDQLDLNDALTDQRWRTAERALVGTPSPFLMDNECSIYEHRPFACRVHLSLDDDDLLCQLDQSADVPMPRLDTRLLLGLFLSAQPGAVVADIRDFFGQAAGDPAGRAPKEHA